MMERNLSSDSHSEVTSAVGNELPADHQLPLNRQLSGEDRNSIAVADGTGPKITELTAAVPPVLDRKALAKLLRVSSRSVDRMRQRGQLPAPIIIGTRNPRWLTKEIEKWLEAGAPSGR